MDKESINPGSDTAYLLREEMGKSMPIDIWYEGNVWVFRPGGRIDAGHSVDLDAALTEGIEQGMRLIVIDLTDTTYISSSGIRAIIRAAKAVKPDNGSVGVCGMKELVSDVFRLSGLTSIIPTYQTSSEAVRSFQNSSGIRDKKRE